jgi:hypothetical protein
MLDVLYAFTEVLLPVAVVIALGYLLGRAFRSKRARSIG